MEKNCFRFSYQEKILCAQNAPKPCTKDDFYRVINDPQVKSICNKIQELKKADQLSHEALTDLKKQLPGFCYAATFGGKSRCSANAVPSGLAMLDIDHVNDPIGTWRMISNSAIKNGCVLAHVTPSGEGLRIVYERPEDLTIEESMLRMAKELGIEKIDTSVKDLSRVSFAVPQDYVLHIDEENLFESKPFVEPVAAENTAAEPVETTVNELRIYPTTYKGIAYADIIGYMLEEQGYSLVDGMPQVGERHNALKFICPKLRHICDFDYNFMMSVLPDWGLPKKEVEDLVKAAINYDKGKNAMPRVLTNAITHLEYEQTKSVAEIDFDDDDQSLPMPAKMPKMINRILKVFPANYRPAALAAIMPVLGTLATRVRSKYINELQTPTFLSCIVGPQASGKGSIKKVCDFLAHRLQLMDQIEEEKMRIYEEEKERAKNKREQPIDPKPCIRMVPERTSNTALSLILDNAKGQHVIFVTPEIDSIAKNQKAAWSSLDDILRKSYDADQIGQFYLTSHKGRPKALINLMMTGTPHAMRNFFQKVEEGLVSRVSFAQMPSTYGRTDQILKPYTENDEKIIKEAMRELMREGVNEEFAKACGGEYQPQMKPQLIKDENGEDDIIDIPDTDKVGTVFYSLPRLENAMKQWQEERAMECRKQYNNAKDTFRRRAAIHGYRAGMIFYCLEGHKVTDEVIAAAKYCADLMLDQQLTFFGKPLDEANEKERQKTLECSTKAHGYKQLLYDAVPNELTMETLANVCRMRGESTKDSTLRSYINRWTKFNMLVKVDKHRWAKPAEFARIDAASENAA